MSALQSQLVESIMCMTDDKLHIVLETINNLMANNTSDITTQSTDKPKPRILGMFDGTQYIAEGYDIDDFNHEILDLFGVND